MMLSAPLPPPAPTCAAAARLGAGWAKKKEDLPLDQWLNTVSHLSYTRVVQLVGNLAQQTVETYDFNTFLSEGGLRSLAGRLLGCLALSECPLGCWLSAVSGLTSLELTDWTCAAFDYRPMEHLASLTRLESLSLGKERSWERLAYMRPPPTLRSLSISVDIKPQTHPMRHGHHRPCLLRFNDLPHSLTSVSLNRWDFGDGANAVMQDLAALPNLRVLDLSRSCVKHLNLTTFVDGSLT